MLGYFWPFAPYFLSATAGSVWISLWLANKIINTIKIIVDKIEMPTCSPKILIGKLKLNPITYVQPINTALKIPAIVDKITFSLITIFCIVLLLNPSADNNPNSLYLEFCSLTSSITLINNPIVKIKTETIRNSRLRLWNVLCNAPTSFAAFLLSIFL